MQESVFHYMAEYPDKDEFVIATVKKIMPYGAFCGLDEYGGKDGFLHISQVSSGWVRNIREHLREGQKVVVKITNVDVEKNQIDLSLRMVSEADRKRKTQSFQAEKKARKLLEVAGNKLKKTPALGWKEAGEPLVKEYGSANAALEAIAAGECKVELPAGWIDTLSEIVAVEYKPTRVKIRVKMTVKVLDPNGVVMLRGILGIISKASDAKTAVSVHYLGAPNYYLDVESEDYKTAEKRITKVEELITAASKDSKTEFSIAR